MSITKKNWLVTLIISVVMTAATGGVILIMSSQTSDLKQYYYQHWATAALICIPILIFSFRGFYILQEFCSAIWCIFLSVVTVYGVFHLWKIRFPNSIAFHEGLFLTSVLMFLVAIALILTNLDTAIRNERSERVEYLY